MSILVRQNQLVANNVGRKLWKRSSFRAWTCAFFHRFLIVLLVLWVLLGARFHDPLVCFAQIELVSFGRIIPSLLSLFDRLLGCEFLPLGCAPLHDLID